ncbi:hypothetical protein N665_1054s0008 [Sinapis alba]|nr:hypothetical protein N665_1054s0008 [Sinapis alba]
MPSLPNEFIPYADNTMNQNVFLPIQITSGNTNHANLFSPSPPFTSSYHASQVYASTLAFNRSRMANQTRRNMVSAVRMPQISGFVNSGFSPVLATPTMPNMYRHANVPTNNMVASQNGHDRGNRVMTSGQTIWNHSPTMPNMYHHVMVPTNNMVTSQNGHGRGNRVMTSGQTISNHSPTMPNMYHHAMVPTNNMVTSQNGHERVITSDPTINPPNVFNNQSGTFDPEPIDYTKVDTSNEVGENKYRTHSMPNENNGSFMCPKCHSLFDISPITSSAGMGLAHASNETNEEKEKGPCARPNKRCREENDQDVNGKARKIESEDKVPEEG